MKKIVALLLIISVMLSLNACGNKPKPTPSSDDYNSGNKTTEQSNGAAVRQESSNNMYLLTKEYSYDADDNLSSQKEYSYFLDGDILVRSRYNAYSLYEWRYDLDGKLLSETVYDGDDSNAPIDNWNEYLYTEDGVLNEEKFYHGKDKLVQAITYNENGGFLEKREYRESAEPNTIYKNIYDANGYLLLVAAYNADGSVWTWCEYAHYDENGSFLSEALEASIAADRPDGTYIREYVYDVHRYLINKKEPGGLLRDGTYSTRETKYTNDSSGNPLTEEVYSGGELGETHEYAYDSDGDLLSSTVDVGTFVIKLEYTYDAYKNILSILHLYDGKQSNKYEYIYENIEVPIKEDYFAALSEKTDQNSANNETEPEDQSYLPVHRDESVVYLLANTEVEASGKHTTVSYEYDSTGRLLMESSGSYINDSHMSSPDLEYQYTEEGYQIKLWEIGTVGTSPEKISYENHRFDTNGNLNYYEMYRASGQMLYYFKIEYDGLGRCTTFNRYTSKDYLSLSMSYEYDEFNNLIFSMDQYDPKTKVQYNYEYDAAGNLLSIYKKKFGDSDYKWVQSNTYEPKHSLLVSQEIPSSGKTTTFDYNGYGQCDKISLSDSDMLYEFLYDEAGNVVAKFYYSGSKLMERTTYEYITVDRSLFRGGEEDYVSKFVFNNTELEFWTGSLY